MNEQSLTLASRAARIWRSMSRRAEPALAVRKEPTVQLVARADLPARAQRRQYAAAVYDRLLNDWVTSSTSHDAELYTSLRTLRNRSRQLTRDNDYAKSAMRVIRNNVVGTGIRMQAQVKTRSGKKLDKATNAAIEAAWQRWCRRQNCHVAGKLSWFELQRLAMHSVAESGEILIRKVRQKFGDSKIPFALEIIEADQLVEDWSGRAENGNEVRMGVEVDQWGRPVAYWLYPRHPGDYSFIAGAVQVNKLVRVPADEIYHLFISDRPGATRGAPWMHSAAKRLNHLGGVEEAEIVGTRASSAMVGFIEQTDIADPTAGEINPGDDGVQDGDSVSNFEPGTIKRLMPGEKFSGWNPARPNAQLDPFLRFMIRGACAGIGVSYEGVSRDYSQSNFISMRLGRMDDIDNWRILQQWMIEHLLQDVYEDWLEMAVLSGELKFQDFETNPERYWSIRWKPRGWESADPLKDATADRLNIRAGLDTQQGVLGRRGEDFEEINSQRRRELDDADANGLVYDTDPARVNDKGAIQPTEPPADAGQGDQDDDTPDDAGDGGATAADRAVIARMVHAALGDVIAEISSEVISQRRRIAA